MRKENLVNPFKGKYPQYLSFSMTVLLLALTFFLSMTVALQSQNIKQKSENISQITQKKHLEETKNINEWNKYINTEFKFTFLYPKSWPNAVEKTISTNSGPAYKEIVFGQYLTIQAKDERYNSPFLLEDLFDNEELQNISTQNFIAFKDEDEVANTKIYISESTKSAKNITLIYNPSDSLDVSVYTQIFSTFEFLPDTSEWKTYINERYGFESKYHPDSPPTETEGDSEVGQFTYLSLINFSSGGSNPMHSLFGYSTAITNHDLESKRLELVGHVTDKIDSEEKLTINGNEWTLLNYQLFVTTQDIPVTTAHILKNGVSYEITANKSEINQILSTFKFLDIKIFNGHETYTNKKLGFSFRPPDGWNLYCEGNPLQFANYIPTPEEGRDYDPELDDGKLKLEIYYETSFEDLDSFVTKKETQQIEYFGENTVWIEIPTVLDGQKAVKVTTEWYGIRLFHIYVIHPDKKMLFNISFGLDFNDHQSVMNQILSTFEFTE